ncbi:hypothetical protein SCUCBS95973_002528 [Sporothrix curviconia]|uniref:BTB domain-containing protein n=1 Tax=Sporothrix curviconia TaxID=1260050 RepID=A0ABP0B7V8_9PEZI
MLREDPEASRKKTVNIDGFTVEVVQCMLSYMYGSKAPLDIFVAPSALDSFNFNDPLQSSAAATVATSSSTAQSGASGLPAPSTGKRARRRRRLMFLVWANAIADHYQVQGLGRLTRKEIIAVLRRRLVPEDFLKVLQVVSIATGDVILHDMLAQFAAVHIEDLATDDASISGLLAPNSFAFNLLRHSVSRIKVLKKAAAKVAGDKPTVKPGAIGLANKKHIKKCMAKLVDTDECSRCAASFACYIDTNVFALRCKQCGNLHTSK